MSLTLLRHGDSSFNVSNNFTGWLDVPLAPSGVQQATAAASALSRVGPPDIVFTSVLKRAIVTAWSILIEMDRAWIPIRSTWRLNERHYGALQGLNKRSAASLYGERVVEQWRREYRGCPPPASPADVSALAAAPQYEGVPIPSAESLRDVVERVAVVWLDAILPVLRQSRHVLVVSHSNTLRALCMIIEGLSEEAIVSLNIPTCVPLSFSLDVTGPRVSVLQKEYLGEDATVRARIEEVAMQSKL